MVKNIPKDIIKKMPVGTLASLPAKVDSECASPSREDSDRINEDAIPLTNASGLEILKIRQDLAPSDAPDVEHISLVQDSTGFVIGGVNSSSLIAKLKEINGVPISELERRMRPGEYSESGFLGKNESLLDVMMRDNDYVLDRNLTHKALARPLGCALYTAKKLSDGLCAKDISEKFGPEFVFEKLIYTGDYDFSARGGLPKESQGRKKKNHWSLCKHEAIFAYKGERYKVHTVGYLGYQYSPFGQDDDDYLNDRSSVNVKVTRLRDNESIEFGGLLVDMIGKYGFYEGLKMPRASYPEISSRSFRLAPQEVVDIFKLV